MSKKIAVAIFHGAGTPKKDFATEMIEQVSKALQKKLKVKDVEGIFSFEPVFWSSIFEKEQAKLWNRLQQSADLDFPRMRRFVIEFLADAVAYQPTPDNHQSYDRVNAYVAKAMNRLREKAGADAPLCVISYSLGTIVASNYFYDLQFRRHKRGLETIQYTGDSPIEKCETLTLFYTTGSPMALWSLRYIDFGAPITVPSPKIKHLYPNIKGEWINFYDKDDVLAFPLKGINEAYSLAVTKDVEINTGGFVSSWNPLSHFHYDRNEKIIETIAKGLAETWRSLT
ncbi:chemotaxis protein [Oceanobacillus piezotolerans]|uniref:Chemotaxis protein n=1 Tax=Oceanobacillus piezotolerans TaxID=2448030 RepID=A0A498DAJ7_9BACI|nr:chemotaxis protein [Oceanobacillus piezotolerans]RLL46754.1 chemotaxis protein [Oceanobacillus piezotolerans]